MESHGAASASRHLPPVLFQRHEAVAYRIYQHTLGDGEVPVITAQLTSGETSISIDAWCSDTGEYYLFLPSWAEGRLIQTEGSGLQTVSGEGSKSFSLPILSSGQSFRLEGGRRSPF